MTEIEAIIRPFKLEEVQKGHTEGNRGAEYAVDLIPKIKIKVVVGDANAPEIVDVVAATARTGRIGVGREILRIRTGERAYDAI